MKKFALEIKWGLIFTGVALLWMVFEKTMGWHGEKIEMHPIYTNIFAVIAIAVFVFALRDKRRQLGGAMSWKEGFISGAIISVVVMILTPLSQYITHTFLSPEYFTNAIKYGVDNGLTTQEDAEAYFNLKNYIIQSTIFGLVMGLITSAIIALFLRTKEAK